MATRIKSRADNLYEQDLYAWSRAQADLLRAARFAELDLQHLIEEIEDVGGALTHSVRNRMRTIIEHLLKLEQSPATEPRAGWRATVRSQRIGLRDVLTPTLRRESESELAELYQDARGLARGCAARSRRARRRRRAARNLPLQPRPDRF